MSKQGAHMKAKWRDPQYAISQCKAMAKGRATVEGKAAISAALRKKWADPIVRAKFVASAKRRWAKPSEKAKLALWKDKRVAGQRTSKCRALRSALTKAAWADPVSRAKRIAGLKKSWQGKKVRERRIAVIKTGWPSCLYVKGKTRIAMRSWWEVALAHWYDLNGISWRYEPHFFYLGKGSYWGERYVPDFYLPAIDEYVEVKGFESASFKAKFRKFRKLYPDETISILRHRDLIKRGVIKRGKVVLSAASKREWLQRKAAA